MKKEHLQKVLSTDYSLIPGSSSDHAEVLRLSMNMDLDVKEFNINDFCVVKRDSLIVGFGRLRSYQGFKEVATVGIVEAERTNGLGSAVVNCLVKDMQDPIFLTCVIPTFFSRLGFVRVKDFPCELSEKYDFCRSFGYSEEEVHVMKFMA